MRTNSSVFVSLSFSTQLPFAFFVQILLLHHTNTSSSSPHSSSLNLRALLSSFVRFPPSTAVCAFYALKKTKIYTHTRCSSGTKQRKRNVWSRSSSKHIEMKEERGKWKKKMRISQKKYNFFKETEAFSCLRSIRVTISWSLLKVEARVCV